MKPSWARTSALTHDKACQKGEKEHLGLLVGLCMVGWYDMEGSCRSKSYSWVNHKISHLPNKILSYYKSEI